MDGLPHAVLARGRRSERSPLVTCPTKVGPTQLGGCRVAGWSAGARVLPALISLAEPALDRKLPFVRLDPRPPSGLGRAAGGRRTPKKQFDCPKLCSQAEAAPALHGSPLARYGALRWWTESRLMV